MKKMVGHRTVVLWIVGLLIPLITHAQFLDYGTDPSRLKWNKAILEHYTLIYPQGLDSMAYRYALYLENAYPHIMKTIGPPVKTSFPVVLHPASMTSNGIVSWSPRRMELLTTPSFSQTESWDKHLVLHESRHVLQTGKLMTGIFRPLYYLIGEQAAGISSLFVPRWFFEGDAVGTETALSGGGRGRLPEFQMVYRAQMLSGSFYSFDKWYLGSYKDYTGDFYALGYNLTSFARYAYGADVWDKTTSRYVKRFLSYPPFSKAFKRHTGVSFNRLFNDTFSFLKDEWENKDSSYITPVYLTSETKHYTSYKYPQAWNDSVIIGVKSSLSDIPSLVAIRDGHEKRLAYTGSLSSRIILHRNRIYWMEHIPNIRWTHENHSVIKYYNLDNKRVETFTPHRRYIAFAVDDSIISASLFTEKGENLIVLTDPQNGNERITYPTPGNVFIKELTQGGKDTLYAIATGDEGTSLLSLDTHTGQWEEWLKPTSANIASPMYYDGKLYFESGLNGTNNLYYLDTSNRKTYRLTSARFGAFQPALSTNKEALLFADYQAKGYRIAFLPADSLLKEESDFTQPERFTLAETLARQEGFKLNASELKPVDFQPRPYRKAAHLFRVHSWAPVYYNVNEILKGSASDFTSAVKPGVTLLSQNALNTAITQAAWYYSNGNHHAMLGFTYQGWFPVINLDIDYGGKAFNARWSTNEKGDNVFLLYHTNRDFLEARLQAYLPLNLTTNHYIRGIQPSITYYFTNNLYQSYGAKQKWMIYFQYLLSEIRLYNYRKMAQRDILPRLGYQLRLQYLNMPFNSTNYSNLYAARLTTYWPGIMPNHSLMLRTAYQYQPDNGKPLFIPQQLLESPRGHSYLYRTLQQAAMKVDYAFPIATPDLTLSSLAYLRRLRANLFYDLTYNQESKQHGWTVQSSYGGDLVIDWNALQLSLPLTTGIRVIRPVASGITQVEALFSVSF
jgi:hypothetical protein